MYSIPAKSVLMLSGGIDSTYLAYTLRPSHPELRGITMNYGQKSWINSLRMINRLSLSINIPVQIIDIPNFASNFVGFMDPEYDRDMVIMCEYEEAGAFISLIAIAASWAAAIGYDALVIGYNKDDRVLDPDRYASTHQAHSLLAQSISTQLGKKFEILMPLWDTEKKDIVKLAVNTTSMSFDSTWSCWRDSGSHCGVCPGCVDRKQVFAAAGIVDSVDYSA